MSYNTIKVYEGIRGIREKLSMYIGSTTCIDGQAPRALTQMMQEVLSNSLDEYVAGYGNTIELEILSDNTMIVKDQGRGVPMGKNFKDAINAFTASHASGKFDDTAYSSLGITGTHGIGAKAVNAGSDLFKVEVVRNLKPFEAYSLTFSKGQLVEKQEKTRHSQLENREWFKNNTGTIISFHPDTGPVSDENPRPVLDSNDWPINIIENRLCIAAFLNPGITITLKRENSEPKTWHYPEGMADWVKENTGQNVLSISTIVKIGNHDFGVDMALAPGTGEIYSFANGVPTPENGPHYNGYKAGILQAIKEYSGLKDLQTSDVVDSIDGAIHVKIPADIIEFEGQTKEKLGTSLAKDAVQMVTTGPLLNLMFTNKKIARDIVLTVQERLDDRMAVKKAKDRAKLLRKSKSKLSLAVSSKLKPASSNKPAEKELYVVEGDSASNIGRNPKTQAVFPLRGKIKNVFDLKNISEALENKEISTIISTLGAGVLSDFDPAKLEYHKFIINADADQDGEHIKTLLLGLVYRLFPGMIEAGHVYVTIPPLYKATKYVKGEPVVEMMYSETEMAARRSEFKGWDITRFKGLGEMSVDEARVALADPKTRHIVQVSMMDAKKANNLLKMLIGKSNDDRKNWAFSLDFSLR